MAKDKVLLVDVDKAYRQHFEIVDPYLTKLGAVMYAAHRLDTDPVWLLIVAASGAGKTEFINSLVGIDGTVPISSMTPKALISGKPGKDGKNSNSLLFKHPIALWLVEDFTTILSLSDEQLQEILGILRGVYGGKFDKFFGTGENMNWEGKITIFAGVTHAIDDMRVRFGKLGERFLTYRPLMPEGKKAALQAMKNHETGAIKQIRKELEELQMRYASGLHIPKTLPKMDEELRAKLIQLANFTAVARAGVPRGFAGGKHQITDNAHPESPTRIAAQLQTTARSQMVVNSNEAQEEAGLRAEDISFLYELSLDSIQDIRRKPLRTLAQEEMITTAFMATKHRVPTDTARTWLEDLNALQMVERIKQGGSQGDTWQLLPDYRDVMTEFDNVSYRPKGLVDEQDADQAILDEEEEDATPHEQDDDGDDPVGNVLNGL